MKNPIKIEIRQTDGNELDVKTVDLLKMLYASWLADKSDGILRVSALIVCDSLLTKEERDEVEKDLLGATLDERVEEIAKK